MAGILQTLIGSLAGVIKDAYFKYVTLLLPGNGTNGAQNNTFLDASTNNFTITRNGNTTQGTFTPYGANWSNYFPSAGSTYLACGTSTNLALGAGDFTVETWVYVSALAPSYSLFLDWRGNAGGLPLNVPILGDYLNNGKLYFGYGDGGTGFNGIVQSSSTIPLNSWTHIAVVRSGTTVTMYFNGSSVGSGTSSVNFGTVNFSVSNPQASNYTPAAYHSNVRIVKGTAVYTGAFTPPTAPLTAITNTQLLTCQSNRFIDNSSNAFAITVTGSPSVQVFSPFSPSAAYSTSVVGGSGYFDGTGDYLTVADNAALNPGSSDFTIEAWIYTNTLSSLQLIHYKSESDATGVLLAINNGTAGKVNFYAGTGGSWNIIALDSTTTITANSWNHIAATRNGSTWTIWINGASSGTASSSGTPSTTTDALKIGRFRTAATYDFNGYISNYRFVKGTAVYTAAFTPPTAPLTAITNTSLLLLGTNAGIIDNAMMNDLETVGNAQISTTQSKFGGSSIAFDGTGDYLKAPGNQIYAFGTGDYTIETWVRFSSVASAVLVGNINGSGYGDWAFLYNSASAVLRLIANNVAVILSSSSWTPSANTWYHVAITRSGTTYRFFVDGTVTGSGSDSTNISWTTANSILVGSANDSTLQLNGYIDDLRITKGYARYTANFTAPTAAFPTQ